MGVLKDAMYLEVWKYLRPRRDCSALLSSLNSPIDMQTSGIRSMWSTLQANGKDEGVKKSTNLKSILLERPDLFNVTNSEKGHPIVILTQQAQQLELDDQYSGDAAALAAAAADPSIAAGGQMPDEMSGEVLQIAAQLAAQGGIMEPAAKRLKATGPVFSGTDFRKPMWKNGMFCDLVWTPELGEQRRGNQVRDKAMARALFEACESYPRATKVTPSMLGGNFKVSSLKKEVQFKNEKLLDILKRHSNVFELTADATASGGYLVTLQPGAAAGLPDAEEVAMMGPKESDLMLPERLTNPIGVKDKMQALRIEIIHALASRHGKASHSDLGQEPRVQAIKQSLAQARKLMDFIKTFPTNFAMDGEGNVSLIGYDVIDTSMIDGAIQRSQDSFHSSKGGKGSSKGGKGSSNYSDRNRSSSGPPPRSYGLGAPSSNHMPVGAPPSHHHHPVAFAHYPPPMMMYPPQPHMYGYGAPPPMGAPPMGHHPLPPPGYH